VILSWVPLADRLVFRGVERPIPDHDQRPGIRIVAVTIRAESETGFDKAKLQNSVLEPLREADLIE
jgi:hypothetical protein